MSVKAPSLPVDELRERTVDLLEEGVASATGAIGPLAERASKLRLDEELRAAAERVAGGAEELRAAAERVAGGTEDLIDDLELGDAADRRALLALALLAAGVALILFVVARRRRSRDIEREDQD